MKCPGFKFKPRQVNDSSQSNQGTDYLVSHYQGDPMWQQHLEAISDPEGPHFHSSMAAMAEYVRYSFNL
jgi:hypothetical protein